jgi:hypothetical protein
VREVLDVDLAVRLAEEVIGTADVGRFLPAVPFGVPAADLVRERLPFVGVLAKEVLPYSSRRLSSYS